MGEVKTQLPCCMKISNECSMVVDYPPKGNKVTGFAPGLPKYRPVLRVAAGNWVFYISIYSCGGFASIKCKIGNDLNGKVGYQWEASKEWLLVSMIRS